MFSRRKKKVAGYIGLHGLTEWWLSAFSETERRYIAQQYTPLVAGTDKSLLDEAELQPGPSTKEETSASFLSGLACFLLKPEGHDLAWRILQKAETEPLPKNVLKLHFTYHNMIKAYYRLRDAKPDALEKAIRACEKQIEIAPEVARAMKKEYPQDKHLPRHLGYRQLAIIRRKQGNQAEGERIDKKADEEGWN